MSDEPWEKQRKEKYRDHDFVLEDVKTVDIEMMRSQAVRKFVETRESDNLKLIVNAFIAYLTSKGFRIVDLNQLWRRELDENKKEINVLYDPYGREVKREYPDFSKEKK